MAFFRSCKLPESWNRALENRVPLAGTVRGVAKHDSLLGRECHVFQCSYFQIFIFNPKLILLNNGFFSPSLLRKTVNGTW